jgi:hypothetical protein
MVEGEERNRRRQRALAFAASLASPKYGCNSDDYATLDALDLPPEN